MKGIDSYYYEQGGLCMREGSEYKKYVWADVLTIINGRNQSAVQSENGEYPIYGSGGIMGRANDYLCPEQCTIIGRKGNINKPIFVEEKFWNVDTAFGLSSNADLLLPRYLFYFCVEYNFEKHNKAVTIPSLTKADLLKIKIDLPSIELQQSIVAELDEINNLLQLKKKELETFDKLAQSIFYEMFGDPVTNEKGWDVKKLGEIAEATIGLTYKPENVSECGTIVLRSGNIQDSSLAFDDIVRVNSKIPENKYVNEGDILMCTRNGSFRLVGKVAVITKLQERMSYGAFMTIIRSNMNPYLFEYFKTPAFRDHLISGKTTTVNQITVKMLNDVKLPVPPLSLQQVFADRNEAIEQQKEQVKASINKLEALLASRMQYWFD